MKIDIINTCEDCSKRYYEDCILYCSKTGKEIGGLSWTVMGDLLKQIERLPIPDWCPLEDAVEKEGECNQ